MNHNKLIMKMTEYYEGQPHRIQHFMKVYGYAKMIGEMEGILPEEQDILEAASIVHDIGIKLSEEKYGDCTGKHQEEEGPKEAERMLQGLGYDEKLTERVCYLVGRHHTYTHIDGIDYQILVEADFLVNLYENENEESAVKTALDKIFKTRSGEKICRLMFAQSV